MATKSPKQLSNLFEELETITSELDQENIDLDESLKKFERGLELAAELKSRLKEVDQKVEKIKKKFEEDVEA